MSTCSDMHAGGNKDEKLDLPFDLYTRNFLISKLVNAVKDNKDKLKILDVSGKGGQLKDFLKEDEYYILDLMKNERNGKNHIIWDVRDAVLKNKSFDVVISSDLYDHITPKDRLKTVSELLRLSKNFVILGAPFYSKEVEDAEKKANDFSIKNAGEPHPLLKAHIKNGLPLRDELEAFLIEKGYEFYIIETNNISNWLLLQFFIFYAYNYGIPPEKVSKVYRYYNENFVELGDFLEPTYRKIYLIGERRTLPILEHELMIDKSVDALKRQKLLSLVFDLIEEENRGQGNHIRNLDGIITSLNDQLQLKENEIAEISAAVQEKDNQIRNLESALLSMRGSIAWQLLSKYQGLIERILPLGNRRRQAYDLGLISFRIIVNEGWRSFSLRFRRRLYQKVPFLKVRINKPLIETNILSFPNNIPLSLKEEIVGKFVFPADNLNEIKMLTATYRRRNRDLRLYLREISLDGPIIRNIRVKGGDILDNDYTPFRFKPIKDSAGKTFFFALKSMGEPSAAVWYNPKISSNAFQLLKNGIEMGGRINFKGFTNLKIKDPFEFWILKNEPSKEKLEVYKKECLSFKYKPKISIITPVWNIGKKWLKLAIESVLNQVYTNWELCIADGRSTKPYVKKVLEEYAKKDKRIKIKFLKENKGIAGNSNKALSLATGDFVTFLDHDDELAPFALYEVIKLLNKKTDLDFIYSDEDKIDKKGRRRDPFFKPEWAPDMFLSANYPIHLAVIRKRLIDKVGGFREGYEGSQDYDLFLRVTEFLDENRITHIPKILYHWRTVSSSVASSIEAKPYAYTAAKKALKDAMIRRRIEFEDVVDGLWTGSYRINYKIKGSPTVSIIIPTKDKVEVLKACIESIFKKTDYDNYKIVIVNNQSKEEKTFQYYDRIKNNPKIKILEYNKAFNFSKINNFAASQMDSEYILFLNNDIEVITNEWLTAMLEHAQRKEVGAVGAKLLFPNGTIQHCGIILGLGHHRVASIPYYKYPDHDGYCGIINRIRNLSAVTGACIMMRKEVFEEVGGFDQNLELAFNDIDLCLKIREKGYLIVYTPYTVLYHHESLSRGYDDTLEKQEKFLKEVEYARKKWSHVIDKGDPYYNQNITLDKEDFSIKI